MNEPIDPIIEQLRQQARILTRLRDPTTAMLEMGSAASGYDISQIGARDVLQAMLHMAMWEIELEDSQNGKR